MTTHVYRLVVKLPAAASEPGWEPPNWPGWPEDEVPHQYEDSQPFVMPRRRLYFSAAAAARRMNLLLSWGIDVHLEHAVVREGDWT